MPLTTDLTGRTALVTGCSSGIGRCLAEVLAENGANVVATARRMDRLVELAEKIDAGGAGRCLPVQLDVTDDARLPGAFDRAEAEFGGLVDILVNNAGIPDAQYATKMSTELVDRVLDTNLRAPWLLSTEFARRLIDAKAPGRIVNISSMGAFNTKGGGASLYSVTKGAIVRMTEALAMEWVTFDINVNAIAPGAFDSEMVDGMIGRTGMNPADGAPRKRIGQPRQLGSTLLYLVSPDSEVVTGTVIKADDGQSPR